MTTNQVTWRRCADVDDGLVCHVTGSGDPVVALHGALSTGRHDWRLLAERLAGSRALHVPDLPAHGGSDGDVETVSYDDLDAAVTRIIAHAADADAPLDLVGFSLGATLALRHALSDGQHLARLVLIGSNLWRDERTLEGARTFEPGLLETHDPALAQRLDDRVGASRWRPLASRLAHLWRTTPGFAVGSLDDVPCEVLLVAGDRDTYVTIGQFEQAARTVEGVELLVVPGVGHQVVQDPRSVDLVTAVVYPDAAGMRRGVCAQPGADGRARGAERRAGDGP